MKDPDREIRLQTIAALARFGREAQEALPALVEALRDPDAPADPKAVSVSERVFDALAELGSAAEGAAPSLWAMLQMGAKRKKVRILGTLVRIVPQDRRLVPLLVQSLKDKEDYSLRLGAARALGELGPAAKEAVPDLVTALKATDVKEPGLALTIKGQVLSTLGRIGPAAKAAIPAVQEMLSDLHPSLRSQADHTLKAIQPTD